MQRVREYVRLRRAQRDRQAEADSAKEEADVLEQQLLEEFAEDGVQNMSVDGNTIYLQRQLWASVDAAYSKEDVIDRLRQSGLDHFVRDNYSTQTLSSWLRELEAEEEDLPPALEGVITGVEKFQLRVRRS